MSLFVKAMDMIGSAVIMVLIAYLAVDIIDTKKLTTSGLAGRLFIVALLMLALART